MRFCIKVKNRPPDSELRRNLEQALESTGFKCSVFVNGPLVQFSSLRQADGSLMDRSAYDSFHEKVDGILDKAGLRPSIYGKK